MSDISPNMPHMELRYVSWIAFVPLKGFILWNGNTSDSSVRSSCRDQTIAVIAKIILTRYITNDTHYICGHYWGAGVVDTHAAPVHLPQRGSACRATVPTHQPRSAAAPSPEKRPPVGQRQMGVSCCCRRKMFERPNCRCVGLDKAADLLINECSSPHLLTLAANCLSRSRQGMVSNLSGTSVTSERRKGACNHISTVVMLIRIGQAFCAGTSY